jgi:hypothetical protein
MDAPWAARHISGLFIGRSPGRRQSPVRWRPQRVPLSLVKQHVPPGVRSLRKVRLPLGPEMFCRGGVMGEHRPSVLARPLRTARAAKSRQCVAAWDGIRVNVGSRTDNKLKLGFNLNAWRVAAVHRGRPRRCPSPSAGAASLSKRKFSAIFALGPRAGSAEIGDQSALLKSDRLRPWAHDALDVAQKCNPGADRLVFGRHRTAPLFPCSDSPRLRRCQPCQLDLGNEQLRAHLS